MDFFGISGMGSCPISSGDWWAQTHPPRLSTVVLRHVLQLPAERWRHHAGAVEAAEDLRHRGLRVERSGTRSPERKEPRYSGVHPMQQK